VPSVLQCAYSAKHSTSGPRDLTWRHDNKIEVQTLKTHDVTTKERYLESSHWRVQIRKEMCEILRPL
jgi:hypothetical protein